MFLVNWYESFIKKNSRTITVLIAVAIVVGIILANVFVDW